MSTVIYTHSACTGHNMGPGHPEQPDRLTAVLDALDAADLDDLERRDAPIGDPQRALLVHPHAYVERTMAYLNEEDRVQIDADTSVGPGSKEAVLRAMGSVIAAVDAVMTGDITRAFCAVRPPGHHAEPDRTMGFCLFNNVAIGAAYARDAYDIQRVAVVDFDVHHGNGTQAMVENEPMLFYASTHQMPLYPGSGSAGERGVSGNIMNVPLPPFAGSTPFRTAYKDQILPALFAFAPEIVMISAGFDAHRDDPLAQLNLEEDDFAWVTQELVQLAESTAQGRIVSVLEGGYNLDALGRCAVAHVTALRN